MDTVYLSTTEQDLLKAARILQSGGLAAFPTETVYGLGGNALDPRVSEKIYAAKGRPSDNPLIVHISRMEQLDDLVRELPENARRLAEAIWPGPLTMVLPKKDAVPKETTGGLDTVAVRMPANDAALRLIDLCGFPLAGPSANTSGRPSPTMWEHVKHDLDGRIDAVIMGEPCIGGIESTVTDMTGPLPVILRPGLISPERITEILELPCSYDPAISGRPDPALVPRAPGMKYKHYAPKAQMQIFTGPVEKVAAAMQELYRQKSAEGCSVAMLMYKDSGEAAARLFADLRYVDEEQHVDLILAAGLSGGDSLAYSVMNRMLKSAGYNIIEV